MNVSKRPCDGVHPQEEKWTKVSLTFRCLREMNKFPMLQCLSHFRFSFGTSREYWVTDAPGIMYLEQPQSSYFLFFLSI